MSANSNEKQFVVVENGQRSSGTMTQAQADAEATRRRQVNESGGSQAPQPKVEVKQNLCG